MSKKEDKFLRQLGESINTHRKAQKISFQELAYRCELDKSVLIKITKGTNITITTLYKVASGLNVPVGKLFEFENK